MENLVQRMNDILGPYPSPDEVRAAILLLADHVRRHDELVAAEWERDNSVDARAMPDDHMDALYQRIRVLRAGIAGVAPDEIGYDKEEDWGRMEELRKVTAQPDMADWGQFDAALEDRTANVYVGLDDYVPRAELDKANAAYRALSDTLTERNNAIADMDKRAHALEEKLEYAEYILGVMRDGKAFEHDEDAELGRAIRGLPIKDGRPWVRFSYERGAHPAYCIEWCSTAPYRRVTTKWYADYHDAISEYNERGD